MSLSSSETTHHKLWNRIRGFFQGQLGPESVVEAEVSPLEQLLQPLDILRRQALDQASEQQEESWQGATTQENDQMLGKQQALRADILELHARLGTGLQNDDLEEMSTTLKAHCKAFRTPRPDELSELAMLSVMARFHTEALSWAWQDFQTRLQAAGLGWPDPTGLSPNADADEIERHRQLHIKGVHQAFIRGPFRRFSDLIVGVVPAWRTLFPELHGPVWQKTVYEAVAAALACRKLDEIEAMAEREHDAVEKLVAEALARELAPLQERLALGVGSVTEARHLSDQAVGLCQRVAPDVVWDYLEPCLADLERVHR